MNSTQLVQIRYDFYLNIRKRVESILGQESKALKVYRNQYDQQMTKANWQSVDKKLLFSRLKQSDIVLIGDFHAQKQSSRAFLRIIRKVDHPLVLALECLREVDQSAIESFLNAEITEKEFLNQVSWKKNWNFPWENYRPIFKWAQINKIKIYGINTNLSTHNLKQRDQFSAQLLNRMIQSHKSETIYVQYGDLHLAASHLPKQLKLQNSKLKLSVIFQSPEILYFKIMKLQKELSTDVVKLNTNTWALNSLPPWIKWQDYLLHLESGYDKRLRNSDIDPTDTVAETVQFITKSFGVKVNTDELTVFTSTDDSFFSQLDHLSSAMRKKIIEKAQDGASFYIPELKCGYLSRYSVQHVTQVAAQFIYASMGVYPKMIIDVKKDFYKQIWLEAIVYLFSKVKNPKRKTDTLQDIRSALQKEQFDDRGKEALLLTLTIKLIELQFLTTGRMRPLTSIEFSKYSNKSFAVAAQILGGIIGEKFFYALNKKLVKLPQNKNLFFKNLSSNQFNKIYFESLELIESWPVSFKSKYDKL